MEFLTDKYFLIAVTFVFYIGAQMLQRRTGVVLLNPILISIAAIICFLYLLDIDYETYNEGGAYIDFWLKPAVVALGLPLYRQLPAIRKQLLPLL
ncbi:MAG: LrgB family protein, partial [Muribaculaceae bacterium]|nr:LrgB family protein [Muribaculaceae bacterium]